MQNLINENKKPHTRTFLYSITTIKSVWRFEYVQSRKSQFTTRFIWPQTTSNVRQRLKRGDHTWAETKTMLIQHDLKEHSDKMSLMKTKPTEYQQLSESFRRNQVSWVYDYLPTWLRPPGSWRDENWGKSAHHHRGPTLWESTSCLMYSERSTLIDWPRTCQMFVTHTFCCWCSWTDSADSFSLSLSE